MLRQSRERWGSEIDWDVRIVLVEKIFAIPASRGLCFLGVIVARLKNERIFSASVAWNQIQAANRDQRKYAQKRNKHAAHIQIKKPKWLSQFVVTGWLCLEFLKFEALYRLVFRLQNFSTTLVLVALVSTLAFRWLSSPLSAFRWYSSRTVLPKPTVLCGSEK